MTTKEHLGTGSVSVFACNDDFKCPKCGRMYLRELADEVRPIVVRIIEGIAKENVCVEDLKEVVEVLDSKNREGLCIVQ